MDDQKIIEIFKSKDDVKINKVLLYWEKKYKAITVSFVERHSGTKTEGQDIFSEAIMDFYSNISYLETYNYSAKLTTHFFRICKNKWLNELRKRKNSLLKYSINIDEKWEDLNKHYSQNVTDNSGIYKKLSIDNLKKLVQYAKEAIGEKCYILLKLKYTKIEKYSYEEILKLYPHYKNTNTLKSTIQRCKVNGRKNLRNFYQKLTQNNEL